MAGLGARGKHKIEGTEELFRKTETPECRETGEEQPPVKKTFMLPHGLAERLRRYAFNNKNKEVAVVREALETFLPVEEENRRP